VFAAVRAAWPEERPLGVRISAVDWVEGGWTLDESIEFARELKARGVDWIDVSSAGISPLQKITASGPGIHVPFARAIRRATGVTTMAVGLVAEPKHADAIVADGDADLVAMARAFLREPRWPWRAAAELGATVRGVPQYWRALTKDNAGIFGPLRAGQR
jgi:2,4-dienoyl-CoA reductase-like NADH-dependent reductase (Old Yellow Enzyme family)